MVYTVKGKNEDIQVLEGKVITSITGLEKDSDLIIFRCSDGTNYCMWHEGECCEEVSIEEVIGDVSCLLNSPITLAEMAQKDNHDKEDEDTSFTWTFYKLATIKGYADIRWYGESNGCYSEEVDFSEILREDMEARGQDYVIRKQGRL